MTPAERLRAAATKLRETASEILAKDLTPPWRAEVGQDDDWEVLYGALSPLGELVATTPGYGGLVLADWIAMMSPAVAEPLAGWLDDEADDAKTWPRGVPPTSNSEAALALARIILGSDQ